MDFDFIADATNTTYTFDTNVTKTTGKIASFVNNTTEVVYIDANGIDVTGQVTGAEPWNIITATADSGTADDFTASINTKYMVDSTLRTGGFITMTMPTTTQIGVTVTVTDMMNNFVAAGSKNVITNSITFEGSTTTFEFDVANSTTTLVWTGASYGWKAIIIQP